jgi:hypothetical protein
VTKKILSSVLAYAGFAMLLACWLSPSALLVGSVCFLLSASLKFPIREDEGWTCSCGYDLSFVKPASSKCPECGVNIELEWSSQLGELPRATAKRLHAATVQFIISFVLLGVFFATWLYSQP